MAKRNRRTSKKFRENHPREVGKFYRVSDSKGGHPARVYKSNPGEDTYLIQRFSTKPRKDRKILKHSIDPDETDKKKKSWLVKKPAAIGFDDMTYEEKYKKYRVHEEDMETIKKYQSEKIKKR